MNLPLSSLLDGGLRDAHGLRVIVTGASGTFGRAICERLTGLGARVVGLDVAPREDDPVEVIACDLVFRSIGYRGVPLPGIPFDERRGLISNLGGRVLNEHGEPEAGEYVVGWVKRGPSGVIGTNKKDAADTVARIVEDRDAGRLNTPRDPDPEACMQFLSGRCPQLVTWEGWRAIDVHETGLGEPQGRPRVKLVRTGEMVDIASGALR